jgi:enoyl-CoA hydratase/carnithine racemase
METLNVETPAAGVTLLRLDRPDRLNAINQVMVGELHEALGALAADPSVRAVVLTGAGRGFCSGIDMKNFGPGLPAESAPPLDNLAHQERMTALPQLLRDLPQPVIAAVNGPAVGGGFALCLASDIRICGASASFANAAIRLGLSGAEMGMSYHLPRIVGTSVAAEWMLTGRTVSSEEALRVGLVSARVDDDQLLAHAVALGEQVAAHTPLGVRLTKRALQDNTDAPSLAAALELENRNQVIAAATPEAAAIRAGWSR